jgi:hypothetical protein
MFKFVVVLFSFFLITGCSFSGSPDSLNSDTDSVSSDVQVLDESDGDDFDEVNVFDSVLDIPGASESSWSPFFISEFAANSFQFGAPGQVLVFDEFLTGSGFNVVSGDSLEFVDLLVYDGVSYSPGLRIVSSGESVVEVVSSDGVSILFSFTVAS